MRVILNQATGSYVYGECLHNMWDQESVSWNLIAHDQCQSLATAMSDVCVRCVVSQIYRL